MNSQGNKFKFLSNITKCVFLRVYATIVKDTYTPVFTEALFTMARIWKEPKCPLADKWINKCGKYIQWNTTQP